MVAQKLACATIGQVQQVGMSRRIAAPAGVVWGLITDIEASPKMLSAVASVEMLTEPGPLMLGTTWRETRTVLGRPRTEQMRVTALIPGQFYAVVSDAHHGSYSSTLSVTPQGPDACTLTLTFRDQPAGMVGRLGTATIGRAFAPAIRRVLARDLSDIAAAAELRG